MSNVVQSRRQWQIQDGPRGTLRKLRKQLAEDGCVESQVVIAKRLLVESVDTNIPGTDWRSDTTQAVRWLTKASEYGNSEAADLLDRCLKSETGITEQNRGEVKMCVDMSDEERAFRCAARKLFISLTPFGQEFVTTRQLRAIISARYDSCTFASEPTKQFEDADSGDHGSGEITDRGFLKWYQDTSVFEVRLDEDSLVENAGRIARGELPNVSLIDDAAAALDENGRQNSHFARKVMNCITGTLTAVSSKTTTTIEVHCDFILNSLLLPLQDLRTLVLAVLLLCGLLPFGSLLVTLLPIVAFYISVIVMAISSVQMMCNATRQRQFAAWIDLFRTADTLNAGHAETNFCRRHLRPYFLRYFIALISLMCFHPFCASEAVLASELTALSASLFVGTVVTLNITYTWHVRAFLMTTLLLTLVRLAGFDDTSRTVIGDVIVLHVGINLIPVAILMFVLMSIAFRGLYTSLLPNLVALAWLHVAGFFFPDVTWFGLARGFGIQVAILALPTVATLLVPFFSALILIKSSSAWTIWPSGSLYPTVTAVCLVVVVVIIVGIRKNMLCSNSKWNWKKLLIGIELLCGFLVFVHFVPTLLEAVGGTFGASSVPSLDWKTYSDLCHEPTTSTERISMLEMQINCHHLSGLRVRWRGHVKSIRIVKIDNSLEEFVGLLPSSMAAKLRCFYGKAYGDCNTDRDTRTCVLLKSVTAFGCHLSDHDRYDFEVEVSVESNGYWNTAEVALIADDSFRSFVFQLVAGDQVDFEGILDTPVIGRRPVVRIAAIACKDCVHEVEAVKDRSAVRGRKQWFKTFGFIFKFIFYPHAELKIEGEP